MCAQVCVVGSVGGEMQFNKESGSLKLKTLSSLLR